MGVMNLLEKTELWIENITLDGADLTALAGTVAQVLGLPAEKVMVVDVRPNHITLDVLEKEIPEENILGKEEAVLAAVSALPGVQLSEESRIHSNGILGLICAQTAEPEVVLRRVESMRNEIMEKVRRRAIVYPTGFELEQGLILDTNTPYLKALLEKHGYKVTVGRIIPDDENAMTEELSEALDRGFGLIITTGGVGAEDKDHSVESVLNLDPDAATPYIVRYERGHGRHVKDGVRIGVGRVGLSTLVTLPGPHDEVEMTGPLLVEMLEKGMEKEEVAVQLASVLAEKWKNRSGHFKHGGN